MVYMTCMYILICHTRHALHLSHSLCKANELHNSPQSHEAVEHPLPEGFTVSGGERQWNVNDVWWNVCSWSLSNSRKITDDWCFAMGTTNEGSQWGMITNNPPVAVLGVPNAMIFPQGVLKLLRSLRICMFSTNGKYPKRWKLAEMSLGFLCLGPNISKYLPMYYDCCC